MFKQRDKETLIRYLIIAAIILVGGAAFVLFYDKVIPQMGTILRFIGVLIGPFVIAWLVAAITRPFNQWMINKLHLPPSLAVIIMILLFFSVVGLVVFLAVTVLISVISTLSEAIAVLSQTQIGNLTEFISNLYNQLGLNYEEIIGYLDQIKDQLLSWASQGVGMVFSVIKATPMAVFWVIITLIAIFYWCRDEEKIRNVLSNATPKKHRTKVFTTYDSFSNVVGKYIRAQVVLITISFILCTVGFFIVGVENPIAMGLFTGVMDIIPILGPGTVIVPWAIFSFITGDVSLGIGLLVIYIVVSVSRYILEPKIVGDRVGLHPLATLAALFVGLKAFGIVGLILGPITLAVIVGIFRARKQKQTQAQTTGQEDKAPKPVAEELPKKAQSQKEKKDSEQG